MQYHLQAGGCCGFLNVPVRRWFLRPLCWKSFWPSVCVALLLFFWPLRWSEARSLQLGLCCPWTKAYRFAVSCFRLACPYPSHPPQTNGCRLISPQQHCGGGWLSKALQCWSWEKYLCDGPQSWVRALPCHIGGALLWPKQATQLPEWVLWLGLGWRRSVGDHRKGIRLRSCIFKKINKLKNLPQ